MNPQIRNWLFALGAIAIIATAYEVYRPLGLALGALAVLAIVAEV